MMVRDKYAVRLAQEQREELQRLVRVGKNSARVTARARILLKSGDGWAAPQVAEALDVALSTVYNRVSSALPKKGWRRFCGTVPRPTGPGSWTIGAKPTSSPWPAAQRRRGTATGLCGCWPGRWWSWGWCPPCPMRESESVSKKHSQAVAEEGVVHPQGERRVRGQHGGCPGSLRRTL